MTATAIFSLLAASIFLSMPIGGRPMLLFAALFILVGLQFVCFGLLAEILVRTYHESQNKKIYTVRESFRCGGMPVAPDFEGHRQKTVANIR